VNRVPPHTEEFEQAVLACLMIEAQTFDKVAGTIHKEDFYNGNNKIIFETIDRLYNAGQPYDLAMVNSALKAAGLLEQAGGIGYLISLTNIVPNAANIKEYAKHVENKAKLRKLICAATEIHELVYEFDKDITLNTDNALDEAGHKIFELAKEVSHKDPLPLSDLILEVNKRLDELYNRDEEMTGVPSGFIDLDKITNGFQPGALVIVGGRPGMGKTAFALNIAQNAASAKKRVAIFSLEMTSSQLAQRLISMESEISSHRLMSGRLTDSDWECLPHVYNMLSELPIYIDDTSNISVMEIRAKCRRMSAKKEQGLDLVVVDYLQLMEDKSIESREQQISSISRNLKSLAKDLNVPVIALSQLNRKTTDRPQKRPQLSDLRESGAIEQDADLVIFVHREDYYKNDKDESVQKDGIAEIIVAKNRNGPIMPVYLSFQGELTKFRDCETRYSVPS
jgi:replicative DNA helicase